MNNSLARLLITAAYACLVWAIVDTAQTTSITTPMLEHRAVVSKAQATLPPGNADVLREQSVSWLNASGLQGLRSRISRETRLTGHQLDAATLVVLDGTLVRLAADRAELESAYAAWTAAKGKLHEYLSLLKATKAGLSIAPWGGSQTTSLEKIPSTCGESSAAVMRFFKHLYTVPGGCSPPSNQIVGLPEVEAELKWVMKRIERIHSMEEDVGQRLEDQERQRVAIMEALAKEAERFSATSDAISLP